MAIGSLRREEQIGLAVAVALHAALIGLLLLRPAVKAPPVPQPISVTLSDDSGLTATAPSHADAAADVAPTLGAPQHEVVPAPVVSPPPPQVEPMPMEKPLPEPKPVTLTKAEPVSKPVPLPRPKPHPVIKPQPKAVVQPEAHVHRPTKPAQKVEDTIGEALATAKPVHKHVPSVKDWSLAAPATHQPAGATRIGNDFLKGVAGGKTSGKATTQGAAVIGPEVKSALSGAITRQLKPHWVAPEGADADALITVLAWDLNRDGTIAGTPRVISQSGITDSNRPQVARHAEQAIRAVELAAPFQLPPQYYDAWKHVRSFQFNRKLSQ